MDFSIKRDRLLGDSVLIMGLGIERRTGFLQATLSVLGPFLHELGFRCVRADPIIVRYESDSMFCVICRDWRDYSIDVSIGTLPYQKSLHEYSMYEIMKSLNIPWFEHAARDAPEVRARVEQLTDLLRKHCEDLLKGDAEAIRGFDEKARRVRDANPYNQ